MKFCGGLLAVTDLERSKTFYKKYLGQDVIIDFGTNVTLTGGFSLQTLESWRGFIGGLDVCFGGNDTELYFEVEDYDSFLWSVSELELVHPPVENPWGQRGVRFYDPDGHIIEVGEALTAVAKRFKESGMNISQIAERMDVKEEYVLQWLDELAKPDAGSVMIKGNNVELVPAELSDKQKIYDWCYHSETTKSHSGPPDYPENPIASFEEFLDKGYAEYFFTGDEPGKGRGFMILHGGEPVGFISYCSFHLKPNKSELDIWMNSEANCGKGFGSDAIAALGAYLNKTMDVNELIMRPSVRNTRAIKAYMKAGFEKTDKLPGDYLLSEYMPLYGAGDYGEGGDVLLVKRFD